MLLSVLTSRRTSDPSRQPHCSMTGPPSLQYRLLERPSSLLYMFSFAKLPPIGQPPKARCHPAFYLARMTSLTEWKCFQPRRGQALVMWREGNTPLWRVTDRVLEGDPASLKPDPCIDGTTSLPSTTIQLCLSCIRDPNSRQRGAYHNGMVCSPHPVFNVHRFNPRPVYHTRKFNSIATSMYHDMRT
jgi:hypothetical protein